jgi:hypothetical protein
MKLTVSSHRRFSNRDLRVWRIGHCTSRWTKEPGPAIKLWGRAFLLSVQQ